MYQAKNLSQLTFEQILLTLFNQAGINIADIKSKPQIFVKDSAADLKQKLQEMEKLLLCEVFESYFTSRQVECCNYLSIFQNKLDFLYQKRYVHLIFAHVQLLRCVLASLECNV